MDAVGVQPMPAEARTTGPSPSVSVISPYGLEISRMSPTGHGVVQDGGDLAAVVLLRGEAAARAGVTGERVLADLAEAVREGDLDADVLARQRGGDGGVVGRFQGESHRTGAGGVLAATLHGVHIVALACAA